MVHDFITEEIREIRQRLAAQFDNDVYRIGDDLRQRQAASSRRVVQLPKRPPRTHVGRKAAEKGTEIIIDVAGTVV